MRTFRAIRFEDTKDDPIIIGYVGIWNTRDCWDTWFNPAKPPNLGLGKNNRFLPLRLMYEHGMDDEIRREIIGEIFEVWVDDIGIAFKAKLYRDCPFFERIYGEIERGELATSSASAGHLAEFTEDLEFGDWYLTEVTATRYPCEEHIPVIELITTRNKKIASYDAVGRLRGQSASCSCGCSENSSKVTGQQLSVGDADETVTKSTPIEVEQIMKEFITLLRKLQSAKTDAERHAALRSLADFGIADDVDRTALLAALVEEFGSAEAVMELLQQMTPAPESVMPDAAVSADMTGTPAITGDDWDVLKQLIEEKKNGQRNQLQTMLNNLVVPRNARPSSELQALSNQLNELRNVINNLQLQPPERPEEGNPQMRHERNNQAPTNIENLRTKQRYWGRKPDMLASTHVFADAIRNSPHGKKLIDSLSETFYECFVGETVRAAKEGDELARQHFPYDFNKSSIRANEIMNPENTGFGAEWIAQYYSDSVWEKVQERTELLNLMQAKGMRVADVPLGYSKENIPIEGADPTVYGVRRAKDVIAASQQPKPTVPMSKVGTGNRAVPLVTMAAGTVYDQKMEEWALVDATQQLRKQMEMAFAKAMEEIIINGDDTLTDNANINAYDGVVPVEANTGAVAKWALIDGLLHLPLIENPALAFDANNTLNENMFLELIRALKTVGNDRRGLLFVMDTDTETAVLSLPVFKDASITGSSTMINELLPVWRVDFYGTRFMYDAAANGRVSVTAANNTFGRILCVRPDQWVFANRREVRTYAEMDIRSEAWTLTSFADFGIESRDTDSAALYYEVNRSLQI